MTPDEIEVTWSAIESEGRTERGWHVRKISAGSAHELHAGRRMPQGSVGLLYDLDADAVPPGAEWPDGKGFRTDIVPLAPGPGGRVRVSLELTVSQYREVFAALCGDIAGVVLQTTTSRSAFSAFLRRLHAWQKFMQLHADHHLSSEQIQGLFAELHVIETLLAPMLGDAAAVEAWQGRHALHDFDRGGHSLEIKSSCATSDPVFQVSRLDQLDETKVRTLHLGFVALTEEMKHGVSLPELVVKLRARLNPHPGAMQHLEDLLVAAGYHDSQASAYAEPRFVASEVQLHRVCENFPRLRRDSLSEGIVSAHYSVRLATCSTWLTDVAGFGAFFASDNNDIA